MNRLIIIGNGFDLAHNLKTNYTDFFNWIWLEKINQGQGYSKIDRYNQKVEYTLTNDLFSLSYNSYHHINEYDITSYCSTNITEWATGFTENRNTINVTYDSQNFFFKELLKYREENKQWADIEKIFFILLHSESKKPKPNIIRLNKDFEQIKNLFENYLLTIDTKNIQPQDNIFHEIFYRDGKLFNQSYGNLGSKLLILNFNYTDTPITYLNATKNNENILLTRSTEIIQIHGELNNINNPIIFGYGDERGEEYKQIELLDNNYFFEHIKSFAYLNTPNYTELVEFLDENNFDTIIIGHSCGLTDRTLLNTIFEHGNCASIKPLYYKYSSGGDNYQDIVRNISRSIDNKAKMRKLIVNKTETTSTN